MILKARMRNDEDRDFWVYHDKVYAATVIDSSGCPGKDIRFWKEGGAADGDIYGSVAEAYLMNDRGQTIERLA